MLKLICAVSRNNVLAVNNKIPWDIQQEMEFFRKITQNKWHIDNVTCQLMRYPDIRYPKKPILIMGRKTRESIPGTLPGRKCFVVSSASDQYKSLSDAIANVGNNLTYIIGGRAIYEECIENNLVDQLIVSRLHFNVETTNNTIYMPNINLNNYHLQNSFTFSRDFDVHVYTRN